MVGESAHCKLMYAAGELERNWNGLLAWSHLVLLYHVWSPKGMHEMTILPLPILCCFNCLFVVFVGNTCIPVCFIDIKHWNELCIIIIFELRIHRCIFYIHFGWWGFRFQLIANSFITFFLLVHHFLNIQCSQSCIGELFYYKIITIIHCKIVTL